MYRELFKKNADGILGRKRYFDYLQFWGKLSWKISAKQRGWSLYLSFVASLGKKKILSDEIQKAQKFLTKLKYEAVDS